MDDVADIAGCRADSGRCRRTPRQLAAMLGAKLAQQDEARPGDGELPGARRDHRGRPHLGADGGQPFRREGRVKRQVAGPGLHDREDAADHVGAPFQVDTDDGLRCRAGLGEIVREPVRRLLQIPVAHPGPADHHRWRLGIAGQPAPRTARGPGRCRALRPTRQSWPAPCPATTARSPPGSRSRA